MRGGARPGAGRKKGSLGPAQKKRREIAEKAIAEGITPLEVMLNAMRDALAEGDRATALSAAKDAAPYVHPRLSAIDAKVDADVIVEIHRFADQSPE